MINKKARKELINSKGNKYLFILFSLYKFLYKIKNSLILEFLISIALTVIYLLILIITIYSLSDKLIITLSMFKTITVYLFLSCLVVYLLLKFLLLKLVFILIQLVFKFYKYKVVKKNGNLFIHYSNFVFILDRNKEYITILPNLIDDNNQIEYMDLNKICKYLKIKKKQED